ncbi:MAG: hypothetical protein EBZ61_10275, partial [Micrococcales bacterium]|nr:hypothetical protein [Micrococcales bacterium]
TLPWLLLVPNDLCTATAIFTNGPASRPTLTSANFLWQQQNFHGSARHPPPEVTDHIGDTVTTGATDDFLLVHENGQNMNPAIGFC